MNVINNNGQWLEFIARMFFEEQGGYIPAKKSYHFDETLNKEDAIKKAKDEIIAEEKRKYMQFLMFCKFMRDKTNDGTFVFESKHKNVFNEFDLMVMFAIGCEMIERKVDYMTIETEITDKSNLAGWILDHVGMEIYNRWMNHE